ncbi:IclR family transcriptional regulator C-terminal domain-containing protein [Paenibacillus sp. Y412MC10]|uniref:IclR family transcriptional regulator domain-containing protein n=1 Tax=Geobacillus sp. (strain Y412MC10) TaxID=481743 RepID=UPI0011AB7E07
MLQLFFVCASGKVPRVLSDTFDDEETEAGLRCVAVPIFYNDNAIAALAISGPAARLNRKRDCSVKKIEGMQCTDFRSTLTLSTVNSVRGCILSE